MKSIFKFDPDEITNLDLARFETFIAARLTDGREPEPGSLSVLAPRRPGAEALGLYDPQVRDLYVQLAARYPRLPRWVSAGRFTRELILAGITGLRVTWDDDGECPRCAYAGAAEAARWGEIEALSFPEMVAGGQVSPEIEEQWRDLHREF